MTQTSPPNLETLQELLADVDTPPLEHAEALRTTRERLIDDAATLTDLDRLELRFLERQATRRDVAEELRTAVREPRLVALDRGVRRLRAAAPEDVEALFDLVELRASYLHEGHEVEAATVRQLLRDRIAQVPIDERLTGEARERFAAIMTAEEDLHVDHKVHLLREHSEVMAALHERSQEKIFKRMAKRLRNAVVDRTLYKRLEGILGRRGVVALETVSLGLLMVVFVLLAIESLANHKLAPLSEETLRNIRLTDAGICWFFIAEFFFKMALAPARWNWFRRNFITDLLPAIPAVVAPFMLDKAVETTAIRVARFFRVAITARFLALLRPLLALFRLLTFLIRGLDALVDRFSHLINRNFVFFESGTHRGEEVELGSPRQLAFQALRREHVLLDDLPAAKSHAALITRCAQLADRLRTRKIAHIAIAAPGATARDVPVEEAIERLYTLRPDELGMTMTRGDLMALDRVSRVINAPLIRSLPFIRPFSSRQPGDVPEARVVNLGRRIADQMERWRNRVLFFADLHGIVTGPQILDRVATGMVKASQRPAVRLLLFGVLFMIVQSLPIGQGLTSLLEKFVATPLIVLGAVCLVVLVTGRWLKRLAGEAAETLKRTSEAHFINLLEHEKARTRDADLVFLASRVFRFEMDAWEAALALGQHVYEATAVHSDGEPATLRGGGHSIAEVFPIDDSDKAPVDERIDETPEAIREDVIRVAYLYMHFLDGAILHESDIKTTEQLLANLSLENIRKHHLKFSRRDRKRLRRLSLASGSMFSGPYLWFRFITESVALETAKRITEYNRHCMTLQQRRVSTPEEIDTMERWLAKRRDEVDGRILEKIDPPDSGAVYQTTEFNSMDFLSVNVRRDAQIERVFGIEVLELLRADRCNMIREIFGTRPLHRLPRSRRSVNFYRFFLNRLSHGRVLLAPFVFLGAVWWVVKTVVAKTVEIVKEILWPERAGVDREGGRAPFRVALRKIHRMKAPGLLEAMMMRASFDPAYCGAPPTWSFGVKIEKVPELERDMDFLQMRERERLVMRSIAKDSRRRIEQLHDIVRELDIFADCESDVERKLGERAVSIAYVTNREGMRSLFQAERWLERELPRFEDRAVRVKGSVGRTLWLYLRRACRRHPVNRLIDTKLQDRNISRRGRKNFRRAYMQHVGPIRDIVHAWLTLPDGVQPTEHARALARDFFRASGEVSRELVALRAVQSLSVLDVRNYRDLVFRLGRYADDGEDPAISKALP